VGGSYHGEAGGCYQGYDGGAHAHEDAFDVDVVLEGAEEHGDEQDGEDGREGYSQGTDDATDDASGFVADVAGHVDGEQAGGALRYDEDVHELFAGEPLAAVDNLTLHDGHHGVAATEGEGSDLRKDEEHL